METTEEQGEIWRARRDSNSRPIAPELFSADLLSIARGGNWLQTAKTFFGRITRCNPI
jgi:hypothetical protein